METKREMRLLIIQVLLSIKVLGYTIVRWFINKNYFLFAYHRVVIQMSNMMK